MMARPFLIPTVCALAALTSACDNNSVRISSTRTIDNDSTGVLRVVEALQCPQTLGSLTRKGSATEQGTVCTYGGPRGAEVILHLVSLSGTDSTAALKAFEDRLSASLPQAVAGIRAQNSAQNSATATAQATSSGGDSASVKAPGVDIQAEGDKATVRLPGISIDADGEDASVNIGGFNVEANDTGANVDIQDGGDSVSVQANDAATVVRTSAAGDATRANWILTDNRPSVEGWRLVGYEARGPAGGPIVVVTVRSKDREGGDVFDDAKALVTLNVGE
ncbi:methyltransferase type 11 [uncultured Brevundimonas sp.]|uniref:methyltransferase type 11 n=1 Tax=uncultured Brevundimonas sp. TaxID=213418 RepID=UPI0025E8B8A7|nr:methyltransferase type 11 [uncultured Brevundimonas sp.]